MKYWPLPLRLSFRFLFCYYLLYMAPAHGSANLLDMLPGTSWVTRPYMKMWDGIETWTAVHVFHLSGEVTTRFPTGSGDTTLDYIELLCFVVLALFAALVWSVLDRRRPDYRRLHAWLRVLVRYTLAVTMFAYGFAKIFPLQFRTPGFARLMEPYGEFSPMGALWWFMGASTAYIIFCGAAEVLGGLLLLLRRTTPLGAMVSFGVLCNIVALNYCYDVPVKLYSTNLLLMAVFLMAPDLRRLCALLILNRPTEPADLSAPGFTNRRLRVAVVAAPVLFVGYVLYQQIHGGWQAYQSTRVHLKRPPLYGMYVADPLPADPSQWHKVAIEFPTALTVRRMDDTVKNYGVKYDEAKSTITLTAGKDVPLTLIYSRPDPDHLQFTGPITLRLRKLDLAKFLLLSRGFRWINERPFNR
ncbi:MAG: DoxX family membrane protein [Candidatus Sulfopaludibacter sp.]|nr:DoxX family membrane protein [Candidatus Sulfopaludibacter sp.]